LCHAACAAFGRSKYLQVDAQLKCAEFSLKISALLFNKLLTLKRFCYFLRPNNYEYCSFYLSGFASSCYGQVLVVAKSKMPKDRVEPPIARRAIHATAEMRAPTYPDNPSAVGVISHQAIFAAVCPTGFME
jgi:hypothetical protein